MKNTLPLLKFFLYYDGELQRMWPEAHKIPGEPDIRPDPATKLFRVLDDHWASLPPEKQEKYWQDTHELLQRQREKRPVPTAKAVAFDSSILREQAANAGMPWPAWLASQFLIALIDKPSRESLLIGYRLAQARVAVYCLPSSILDFAGCDRVAEELGGTRLVPQPLPASIRPLTYWNASAQTAYRLFPFPLPQKKRRGHVLHVDHGNQEAFFSSYVYSIWPGIWKNNLLEYSDYEVVPMEKEEHVTLRDRTLRYRNAFVILEGG
jgi:hypothetical protein